MCLFLTSQFPYFIKFSLFNLLLHLSQHFLQWHLLSCPPPVPWGATPRARALGVCCPPGYDRSVCRLPGPLTAEGACPSLTCCWSAVSPLGGQAPTVQGERRRGREFQALPPTWKPGAPLPRCLTALSCLGSPSCPSR